MNSRNSDPITSHIAGISHEMKGTAGSNREACLAIVLFYPGLTAPEIAVKAGIDRHEASRRLPELRRKGQVKNGPERLCSQLGSLMMTWEKA